MHHGDDTAPRGPILGAAQKQWLKDGLHNSTATFKFIMNGPPITELVFVPYDRWEAWSAERNEILDFIQNNNIKNVIWLSTDLHAFIESHDQVDATHNIPEIVSGSIAESTIFHELPPSVAGLLPSLAQSSAAGHSVRHRPLQRRPHQRHAWRRGEGAVRRVRSDRQVDPSSHLQRVLNQAWRARTSTGPPPSPAARRALPESVC